MDKKDKILVTGHTGLVGSALIKRLSLGGYENVYTLNRELCDLRTYNAVYAMWRELKPEYVFNCAALVGGINGNNTRSGEFIRDNLLIQTNVIDVSHITKVKKLMFLGSACIYPKVLPQPIKEEYLLSAHLEETNKAYAVAKIAGITMCQMYNKQYGDNFISVIPTNVYGINDNFSLGDCHVLPALLRKFHDAIKNNKNRVTVWGTGKPRREFMYVDDIADALVFLMNNYDSPEPINVGTGNDVSIKELVEIIKNITGFNGDVVWDTSYPDGTGKRSIDITKLSKLGWHSYTSLEQGIQNTYKWYKDNYPNIRL